MPKEPFNKGDSVTRQSVADMRKLFVEEIMLRKLAQIKSSGGSPITLVPSEGAEAYVRNNPIGGMTTTPTLVDVDPNYAANDTFNQYPTMAEGLARADYLYDVRNYERVGVRVHTGVFEEEGLYVKNGVSLKMDTGAILAGPAVPTLTYPESTPTKSMLLAVTGTGRIESAYIQPRNTGTVVGYPLVVAENSIQPFVENVKIDMSVNAGGNWDAGLYVAPNLGAIPTFEDLYNAIVYLRNIFIGMALMDGAGAPLTSYSTPMMLVEGPNILVGDGLLTSGLFTKACIEFLDNASGGAIAFLNNTFLFNLWWAGLTPQDGPQLINTAYAPNDQKANITLSNTAADPALCDYKEENLNLTKSDTIEQDYYPQVDFSATRGTVNHALGHIREFTTVNREHIEENQRNIAILATGVDFKDGIDAGDFSGIAIEQFSDSSGIVAGDSAGWRLMENLLCFTYPAYTEDFSGYADTTALQAAWAVDPTSNLSTSKVATDLDETDVMRIQYNGANSANKWVRYTFPGAPVNQFGDNMPTHVKLRVRAATATGPFPGWELRITGYGTTGTNGAYTYYRFTPDVDFTVDGGYAYAEVAIGGAGGPIPSAAYSPLGWNILSIEIRTRGIGPGDQGSLYVSSVAVCGDSTWDSDLIIEDWDSQPAIDQWTVVNFEGVRAITKTLYTGDGPAGPYVGSGQLQLTGMETGDDFYLEKSFAPTLDITVGGIPCLRFREVSPASKAGDHTRNWEMDLEDSGGNLWKVNNVLGATVYARPEYIYFYLWDGAQTAGGGTFDPTDVTRIRLRCNDPQLVDNGGQAYTVLDRLEVGKPSRVELTPIMTGEAFNQITINAAYSAPWKYYVDQLWPAYLTPGDYQNRQNIRVDVSRDASFPWNATVGGVGPYRQFTLNGGNFGTWYPISGAAQQASARILKFPYSGSLFTNGGLDLCVDGVAVAWRQV